MKVYLATGNANKVKELNRMFECAKINLKAELHEKYAELDVKETDSTFEENAVIKAMALSELEPDSYIVADDSGISVDCLNGAPGVHSARYAQDNGYFKEGRTQDQLNNELLLKKMEKITARTARFMCALALVKNGKTVGIFNGTCEGEVALQPQGSNGFGYDPLFKLPDGRTMAMLAADEKNSISHRKKAFDQLIKYLSSLTQ